MQRARKSQQRDSILVANYAGPRAFAPRTRAALRGLGYELVAATTRGHFDDARWSPDLRIVDERHCERIPSLEQDPSTPIVLLTGSRPLKIDDPRVIGQVARPAGLKPLFKLFQQSLEKHPRRTPRVPTQLSARCIRSDRRVFGAVVSLSEFGCLFRGGSDISDGDKMNLQFALPLSGIVSTRAKCARQEGSTARLLFSGASGQTRRSIDEFVTQRLAAL